MFLRLALASLLVAADVAKGDTSTSDGDTSKLMVHVSRQGPKVVGTKPTETALLAVTDPIDATPKRISSL